MKTIYLLFLDHSHINFDSSEYRHKLTSSMCVFFYLLRTIGKHHENGNNLFFLSFFRISFVFFFFSVFYMIRCFAGFPSKMLYGILFCRNVFKLSLKYTKHWLIFTQKFETTTFFFLFLLLCYFFFLLLLE